MPAPIQPRTGVACSAAAEANSADEASAGDDNATTGVARGGLDGNLFVLTPPAGPRKTGIVPLAPERYKVQFTASADTCNTVRLLCRADHQYEARQFFGVWQASTG